MIIQPKRVLMRLIYIKTLLLILILCITTTHMPVYASECNYVHDDECTVTCSHIYHSECGGLEPTADIGEPPTPPKTYFKVDTDAITDKDIFLMIVILLEKISFLKHIKSN